MSYPWSANDILTASDLNAAFALAGPPAVRSFYATAGTSDQTSISTITDATGYTVTWTADSSRLYKISADLCLQKITAGGTVTVYITDGSNTAVQAATSVMVTNEIRMVHISKVETGLSGSTTRKIRVETSPNTVTVVNTFSRNGQIVVEDLGPA